MATAAHTLTLTEIASINARRMAQLDAAFPVRKPTQPTIATLYNDLRAAERRWQSFAELNHFGRNSFAEETDAATADIIAIKRQIALMEAGSL